MKTGTRHRVGFTLIELVAALLLVGVAGSVLVAFLSRGYSGSFVPAETLREAYALQKAMEDIAAHERQGMEWPVLQARVGAEGSTQQNDYGTYVVEHNRLVAFDAQGVETAPGTGATVLKITIRNGLGERLTRLIGER